MMKKHIPLRVHFIGIGGIGTSALARWFLAQNWSVSGSDIARSKITQELIKEGVKVKIGHRTGNLDRNAVLVVYNQAISFKNPEILEAKRLGIKILSFPQVLGLFTEQFNTVAVAGAHGKSTTTAFVSLVMLKARLDPTVIIGTRLKIFFPSGDGKNFRLGRGKYLLIEACEWKNSFFNYSPTAAIITNIDREHLDFFKNFSNVKKSFLKFMGKIRDGGILILNRDDKNLFGLKSKISKIAAKNRFKVFWYGLNPPSLATEQIKKVLKVPGRHNLSNALAAFTFAKHIGITEKIALKAIGSFKGIWRRLEYRGKFLISSRKLLIPVYDDYAHHPVEIKASLQALREKYPKSKIICVFQPHQTERLKILFKDFVSSFKEADFLIILPVYEVAGRDKKNKKFTSEKLAEAINKKKPSHDVIYLKNPKNLRKTINHLVTGCKLPEFPIAVVLMGAGDIVKYTDLLIK